MQAVALARVGAATGALADHGAAGPQLLQVVGELLGAGERGRSDQHVQRLGGPNRGPGTYAGDHDCTVSPVSRWCMVTRWVGSSIR
jgi:hypothetical protein